MYVFTKNNILQKIFLFFVLILVNFPFYLNDAVKIIIVETCTW